jgi:hypothetical protein
MARMRFTLGAAFRLPLSDTTKRRKQDMEPNDTINSMWTNRRVCGVRDSPLCPLRVSNPQWRAVAWISYS